MKANQIRQIESIINKSFFDMIKLFFVCLLMNNPFFYYGFFPTAKNTFHFSIFSFYPYSQNLKSIGLQFFKLLYLDFSLSEYLVIFISINCFKYYKKNTFFISLKKFKAFKLASWDSLYLFKNQKGFCYSELMNSIFIWSFRILFCILLAAIFSFNDINIPSLQEIKNDIVSSNTIQIIEKLLFQ
jgi:hypothetical protein